MVLEFLAALPYIVQYQVPLFLLVFGIIYVAMAYLVKPLGTKLVVPVGALVIAGAFAWFSVVDGGFGGFGLLSTTNMLLAVGIGIVAIVLGKIFVTG